MLIKTPSLVPGTEYSQKFIQGMVDRMGVSFHKYGLVSRAYPEKVDALKSLQIRIDRYTETGNTEWLMDVANFAMIEFMHPRLDGARFQATDSQASPGRAWHGDVDPSARTNAEF